MNARLQLRQRSGGMFSSRAAGDESATSEKARTPPQSTRFKCAWISVLKCVCLVSSAGYLARLNHRQNCRTRLHYVADDSRKKLRRAAKGAGARTNIMGGKNKPASSRNAVIDHPLNGCEVVPALLEKECVEVIEIGVSNIEGLPSATAAREMLLRAAFRFRPSAAYRVRHCSKNGAWR